MWQLLIFILHQVRYLGSSHLHSSMSVGTRAGQYVGYNCTGAISLIYRDAVSKIYNKTNH